MIEIGLAALRIEDVWAIARGEAGARLSGAPEVSGRIARSAGHVETLLASEGVIYGVTTGYGDSVTRVVQADLVAELPLHLTRFHGCGAGRYLTPAETRAVMAVRLAALAQGWSGVSLGLLGLLSEMLARNILPLIPAEGSVGASGDLTPLSYIAGALAGEREVLFENRRMMSAEAFAQVGLAPIRLGPKEALAVMNGTAVMTGLAALVFMRADYVSRLAARLTAMASIGLLGNPRHFDERLFAAKPHPGQTKTAARIREDISAFDKDHAPTRLQDRYSIRCAPHVVGVLEDALTAFRPMIEVEINSANDNPLFDPETGEALHGGHFYGGHIAFAMDSLKSQIANVADLLDRQFALLVDTRFSNGLPSNLSGAEGESAPINHGLKAVQIAVSAWTAEALKLTMPASVFSRSTECHNQDKVSMGTIAARDAMRVLELTEQVLAAHLIACTQALRLRMRAGQLPDSALGAGVRSMIEQIDPPFIDQDRPLDQVLRALAEAAGERRWRVEWGAA